MTMNVTSATATLRQPIGASPATATMRATLQPYRWIVLLVIWLSFTLTGMDRFIWSSISAPAGRELHLAVSALGQFTTAFYVGYAVSCSVGGVLSDIFGSRAVLTWSLLPLGALTFAFSLIGSLEAGMAVQFMMGVAAGAEYGASVKILASWFRHEKGRAFGIWLTGNSLAVTFTNLIVPTIAVSYRWQLAYEIMGALTVVIAVVAFGLLRNTPDAVPTPGVSRAEFLALLRNRNIILITLAGAAALYGTIGIVAWATALMTVGHGIPPVQAGFVTVLFGTGAVLCKPLAGLMYDRLEHHAKAATVVAMLAFAVLLVVFAQCSTLTSLYLVAPLLGLAAYGFTPLLVGLYNKASGMARAGAAAGIVNTGWSIGSFIGRR